MEIERKVVLDRSQTRSGMVLRGRNMVGNGLKRILKGLKVVGEGLNPVGK